MPKYLRREKFLDQVPFLSLRDKMLAGASVALIISGQ